MNGSAAPIVPEMDHLAKVPTPFHVFYADRALEDARSLEKGLRTRLQKPEFFYSTKTNPLPHLLQEVLALGWGLEAVGAENLRAAIESCIGSSLIDSDTDDVVDAVILWWREDDGDLTDAFVDVLTYLSESGSIWLMTPKVGRIGYLEASDIQDAAPPAGLSPTTGFNAALNWTATKLVARKAGKSK